MYVRIRSLIRNKRRISSVVH